MTTREMEFPSVDRPVIIATKGHPCTWKSDVAMLLATWAGSSIFSIDDFLDTLSRRGGYNAESFPSRDEAEHLHHLAFDALCAAVERQLRQFRFVIKCVVIKSRLCSIYELDRLVELAELGSPRQLPLIIMECQMTNPYWWQIRWSQYDRLYKRGGNKWYKPRNWNDVVKAEHDYDAQAWDVYFLESIKVHNSPTRVRKLVMDPRDDLRLDGLKQFKQIRDPLLDAITYLLTAGEEDLHQHPYVVEFDQLQRFLRERQLKASKGRRSEDLCTHGGCVFEYGEALDDNQANCGACEERVSGPGYACIFCSLILHKSCAEMVEFKVTYSDWVTSIGSDKSYCFPKTHACKSCIKQGKEFSYKCGSCLFQTHLKCRVMPTIVNEECHQHLLSIRLASSKEDYDFRYFCRACGSFGYINSYVCNICRWNYHIRCVHIPREVKHDHGGYDHRMKLVFTHKGREQEDYWCDVCYKDMDPKRWYYSCQECDYYVSHVHCVGCIQYNLPAFSQTLKELIRKRKKNRET